MKKVIMLSLLMISLMAAILLTGCAGSEENVVSDEPGNVQESQQADTQTDTPSEESGAASDGNYVINGSFDASEDLSPWVITNEVTDEVNLYTRASDAKSGTQSLHFYSAGEVDFTCGQEVTGLEDGEYTLSCFIQGDGANASEIYLYAVAGEETLKADASLNGYLSWDNPVIDSIQVTGGSIKVGIEVKNGPGGWGTIDDFTLIRK